MTSDNQVLQDNDRSLALRQATQILTGERGLKLANYEEMYRFAKAVAQSKFKPYSDWTEVDCFICLQKGAEVGMTPMQSLESIYIVNNRAALFGDAPKGLIEASGLMLDYDQYEEGKPFDDDYKWVVMTHRKGRSKPLITTYSVADAKTAGLWEKRGKEGKATPWITAPKRMLMFRARGFNLRDNFPDILKGFVIGELIDEESVQGFEHAKVAAGKVVEPKFSVEKTQEPPPGVASSGEELPRPRRGRPPKSAQQAEKPAEEPAAPEPPTPDEKPAPSPKQPETPELEPAAVAPRQGSLFNAPKRPPVAEITARLSDAGISQERFLDVLLDNDLIDCERGDITAGDFGLDKVTPAILEHAIRDWDKVLQILKQPVK